MPMPLLARRPQPEPEPDLRFEPPVPPMPPIGVMTESLDDEQEQT